MYSTDMSYPPMAATSKASEVASNPAAKGEKLRNFFPFAAGSQATSEATCNDNHYIKISLVSLSVRNRGSPEASLGHWRLEATERMPLCTLAKAQLLSL